MVERVSSRRRTAHDEEPTAGDASGGRRATVPKFDKKTIALVYDFDGTLSPKPMQDYAFLPQIGEDPAAFWTESNALASARQADALITYMHLLYKKAKAKGVRIDRADLVAQGRNVELFPGVEAWFDEIADYVKRRAEPRRLAAPLPRLLGPDRDHRGHAHLQALPQRVRVRILVRGLRPALPQARHHRHRQDAVPVPHQQGRGGPGRKHQPAHARGTRGPSRSPT